MHRQRSESRSPKGGKAKAKADEPLTPRRLERLLRDVAGLTRRQAKAIVAHGWWGLNPKPLDRDDLKERTELAVALRRAASVLVPDRGDPR